MLQLGDAVPDYAPETLKRGFNATQSLVREGKISAGHDVSDGGVVVTLLEMAFAGNCGLKVSPAILGFLSSGFGGGGYLRGC